MASLPAKMNILLIKQETLEKQKVNFSRSVLFYIKPRATLKYFVNDRSQKLWNLLYLKVCTNCNHTLKCWQLTIHTDLKCNCHLKPNVYLQAETFPYFTKFSYQHKWNDVQLLLINMVYMSCLMSCQTT